VHEAILENLFEKPVSKSYQAHGQLLMKTDDEYNILRIVFLIRIRDSLYLMKKSDLSSVIIFLHCVFELLKNELLTM
jgi:hypothetical protein